MCNILNILQLVIMHLIELYLLHSSMNILTHSMLTIIMTLVLTIMILMLYGARINCNNSCVLITSIMVLAITIVHNESLHYLSVYFTVIRIYENEWLSVSRFQLHCICINKYDTCIARTTQINCFVKMLHVLHQRPHANYNNNN